MRTRTRTMVLTAVAALTVAVPAEVGAQASLRGREVSYGMACPAAGVGWVGITRFQCRNCIISRSEGMLVAFSTEPEISEVHEDGPAAGILRAGDVLVAVDGNLITTAEGQRALASAEPGVPVALTVRRGRERRIDVVEPTAECLAPESVSGYAVGDYEGNLGFESLAGLAGLGRAFGRFRLSTTPVSPPAAEELPPPPAVRASLSAGYLGLGFRITRGEVHVADDGSRQARFTEPPEVVSVDPNGPAARAGIRPGDRIVRVDGADVRSVQGASRLLSVGPGQRLRLWVQRESGEVEPDVFLTTGPAPAPPAPEAKDEVVLRYSGGIGLADVEVWGRPVTVEEDRTEGWLIIRTGDNVIRVRVGGVRK